MSNKCILCNYNTSLKTNYVRHCKYINHLMKEELQLYCCICDKNYKTLSSYKKHKNVYHKIIINDVYNDVNNISCNDNNKNDEQNQDMLNDTNNFTKLMIDLLSANTYNSAVQVFRSLVTPLSTTTGKTARIVVCLPDGTVYFDSKNKDNLPTDETSNSFTNASNKDINENHNTRSCIMNAQLVADGVSFESKYSSSTGRYEDYVAMRIGPQGANFGTVRYSVY